MSTYRVLIVDDDSHIRDVLRYALEKEGLSVIEAENGQVAIEQVKQAKPSMIIMDIMMPGMNGLDACIEIRRSTNTPILFLSSKDSELDRVLGLELGGDDYVVKPFSPRELMARVKVILRRLDSASSNVPVTPQVICRNDLMLDLAGFQAQWKGVGITLTVTEFNLLQTFMQTPNKVFTREMLIETDIFKDIVTDRTIDSHIRRLRKKLTDVGCLNAIETVHGFGYRLGSMQ